MAITNIKDLADLASTSLASYAYFDQFKNLDDGLVASDDQDGVGMPIEQADEFIERFQLIRSA